MRIYLLIVTIALIFGACKEERLVEDDLQQNVNAKLSYKVLNLSIDSLSYRHPILLDLNHDSQIDYFLTSMLIEENDKPYLYLLINRTSPNLNKFVVRSGPELVNYSFWAEPLEKNVRIHDETQAGTEWNPGLSKANLISLSDDGHSRSFYGEWIGKQDRYLGLKFKINGKYHYGWLRIGHNEGEDRLSIIDYAYNKEAGKAILAGQK